MIDQLWDVYVNVLKHTVLWQDSVLGETLPCNFSYKVIKDKIDTSLPGTLKHFGGIAKGGAWGREKTKSAVVVEEVSY